MPEKAQIRTSLKPPQSSLNTLLQGTGQADHHRADADGFRRRDCRELRGQGVRHQDGHPREGRAAAVPRRRARASPAPGLHRISRAHPESGRHLPAGRQGVLDRRGGLPIHGHRAAGRSGA